MKMTVIDSGSSGNCYVLEGRRSALILECGVSPEKVMAGTTLAMSKVAGCLVTHEHGDHAGCVQRFADLGLPIYASAGTLDAVGIGARRGCVLVPMYGRPVGEFLVQSFRTTHDAAEPLGFVITHRECGKVIFLTDSREVPMNFRHLSPDHIMVEANYDDALLDGRIGAGELTRRQAARTRLAHLSIRGALEFVQANETAALKTVTLLHLSPYNSNAREFKDRMQEAVLFADVYVAKPGCRVEMTKDFNQF